MGPSKMRDCVWFFLCSFSASLSRSSLSVLLVVSCSLLLPLTRPLSLPRLRNPPHQERKLRGQPIGRLIIQSPLISREAKVVQDTAVVVCTERQGDSLTSAELYSLLACCPRGSPSGQTSHPEDSASASVGGLFPLGPNHHRQIVSYVCHIYC